MFAPEPSVEKVFGAEWFYRELGYYMNQKQLFRRSIPYFNKAVEINPNDSRTLTGRAKAFSRTTNHKCALKDIKKVLNNFPDNLNVQQRYALYKYLLTDFESSLTLNYRGLIHRKFPDLFQSGVSQCTETVEKTVGKRAGHPLRDHYNIIHKIAWKKELDASKGRVWKPNKPKIHRKSKKFDYTPQIYTKFINKYQHSPQAVSEINIFETLHEDTNFKIYKQIPKIESKFQPMQRRTTNIDKVLAEKYLEKMSVDKKFLKDLRNDPRIGSFNEKGKQVIESIARQGYKNVTYIQETLRKRTPYYSIKYCQEPPRGNLIIRQQEEFREVQITARKTAETLIDKLIDAKEAKNTTHALKLFYTAKDFISRKSVKVLPDKELYLKELFDLIARVHLDKYRLKPNMSQRAINKRISFLFGLPISRASSSDSVLNYNQKQYENIRKFISDTQEALDRTKNPLEVIQLFYDLARYHIDLKKWDLSRFYAKKAFNMAKVLKDFVWKTLISFLVTKTLLMQRNKNEAKNELMRTIIYAKQLPDKNELIFFIKKCLEVVETIGTTAISTDILIKKREADIIKGIMKAEQQEEIRHLFHLMDAIPTNRRLPIIPGVLSEPQLKRPQKSVKPTIKPFSTFDLEIKQHLQETELELL